MLMCRECSHRALVVRAQQQELYPENGSAAVPAGKKSHGQAAAAVLAGEPRDFEEDDGLIEEHEPEFGDDE